MDHLTKTERSRNMSKIRSKNTKPEMAVRKTLTKMGIKYRLHSKKLPGKPDIVIPGRRMAVFINGCFWHQHKNCRRKSMPKTNTDYWETKLSGNIAKQKKEIKEIEKIGFKPIIVWECQTGNTNSLSKRLERLLS